MSHNNFISKIFAASGIAACFSFAGVAAAQTVLVDPSLATPDTPLTFSTLNAAVQSFATTGVNGSNPAPNVINLITTAPVVDKVVADIDAAAVSPVTISGDITIQGLNGRATLVGLPLTDAEQKLRNSTSAPPLPFFAWRQPVNITFRNINFLPSDPAMLSFIVFKSPSAVGSTGATIENCVFTANDGTNKPLTLTGKDDPDTAAPGVIALAPGGDAIFALSRQERGDFTLNVKNTVFASFTRPDPATNKFHITSDAIVSYMQGTAGDFISSFLNIYEGTVFANIGRGVQNPYGGYVNVQGTDANPVVFRNLTGSAAIWNYSDTTVQPTVCRVSHAHFYNLATNAIGEYRVNSTSVSRAFISGVYDSVIADCGSDGINLLGSGTLPPNGEATGTLTIKSTVIHNSGSGTTPSGIYAYAAFNRAAVVTDSIFTGPGKYGIANNGSGIFDVSNSTLSLDGVNALLGQTAGTGIVNLASSVSSIAVTYQNMTDPFAANFFKPVTSAVNDWTIY